MQVEPQDAFQQHQQAMRGLQHLYGKEAIPDEVLNFFNVSLTAPTHAARDGSLHMGQTLRKLNRQSGPHQIPGPKALKLQCPKKKIYFTAMPYPHQTTSCKCLPRPPHENVSLTLLMKMSPSGLTLMQAQAACFNLLQRRLLQPQSKPVITRFLALHGVRPDNVSDETPGLGRGAVEIEHCATTGVSVQTHRQGRAIF